MDISCLLFLALFSYQLLLLQLHYSVSAADEESKTPWYKPGCQQQVFNCGRFGQRLKFPYTNETSEISRNCAPGRLDDCSGESPKLNLGSLVYEVKRFPTEETVEVNSPPLNTLLKSSNSCDIFNYYNISFPNTGSVSFTFTPNITLLKCSGNDLPPDHTMLGNHSCRDYRIYYSRKKGVHVTDHQTPPPGCAIITLPAAPDGDGSGDLFSHLASEFTIRFHISTQCQDCINKGNRCALVRSNFYCDVLQDDKGIIAGKKYHGGFISGTRKKVVAGVSAFGILVAVLLFCYFWRHFTGKQIICWGDQNQIHRNVEAILKNNRHLTPNRYTYANVRKMTKSFSEKLGQGGYGQVYKGELRNGTLVAVKILKETNGNGEEFMNEVTSISRTSHINIVPLLGYCYEGRKRALIYEFMPNGSLDKFLHNEAHHLGFEKLHQISLGIAQGLEYLHRGCNTRILHLDIKPQNILLDEEFQPKISDFGLAKLCHNKESIVLLLDARGTIGYIAPEVFCRQYGGVSHKSDVYSYGMMVLDMVEPNKNISEEINGASEMYFPDMIYRRLELIDQDIGEVDGIKDDEEKEIARMMMIVGLWCIQTEPSSRPAMSKVVDMLKGTGESLPIPSRPILPSIPREFANSSKIDYMSSSRVHLVA